MQEVIDGCGAGYQTQKRIQILFNQLYRWCINHEAIQKNYAEQVTVTAKEAPKPRAAFSSEEVAKLWSSLNQHEYISTKTNAFCLGIILCNVSRSFDYLIYPYYPAYTS